MGREITNEDIARKIRLEGWGLFAAIALPFAAGLLGYGALTSTVKAQGEVQKEHTEKLEAIPAFNGELAAIKTELKNIGKNQDKFGEQLAESQKDNAERDRKLDLIIYRLDRLQIND